MAYCDNVKWVAEVYIRYIHFVVCCVLSYLVKRTMYMSVYM